MCAFRKWMRTFWVVMCAFHWNQLWSFDQVRSFYRKTKKKTTRFSIGKQDILVPIYICMITEQDFLSVPPCTSCELFLQLFCFTSDYYRVLPGTLYEAVLHCNRVHCDSVAWNNILKWDIRVYYSTWYIRSWRLPHVNKYKSCYLSSLVDPHIKALLKFLCILSTGRFNKHLHGDCQIMFKFLPCIWLK